MRTRGLAIAVGIVLLAAAGWAAPARFWAAWAATALFWLSVGTGAAAFAAALEITQAEWANRLRDDLESLAAAMLAPMAAIAALVFAGDVLYPWAVSPVGGFEAWLSPSTVVVRVGVAMVAMLLATRWLLAGVAGARGARAVVLALTFALSMTLLSWDLVMSVEPGWVDTLFGAYFFVGALFAGIAAVALSAARRGGLDAATAQDLGKLLFGGAMVWGYLLWSQYLVFWYGNLPHEIGFWFRRTEAGWALLGVGVVGLAFVVPFAVLLPRATKRSPRVLAAVAAGVLAGMWAERLLLLGPVVRPAPAIPVGLIELAVGLGATILFIVAGRSRAA